MILNQCFILTFCLLGYYRDKVNFLQEIVSNARASSVHPELPFRGTKLLCPCLYRERPAHRPAELLYPQADVAERLALGGSDDALANGIKADLQAAKRLAKRLYNLDGFRKSDVARHLSKKSVLCRARPPFVLLHLFNVQLLSVQQ